MWIIVSTLSIALVLFIIFGLGAVAKVKAEAIGKVAKQKVKSETEVAEAIAKIRAEAEEMDRPKKLIKCPHCGKEIRSNAKE